MNRVGVVGGGPSAEHEVSLATADGVGDALVRAGHEVVRLDLARTGGWCERSGTPVSAAAAVAGLSTCDVLFPLVHGPGGEDGSLAALANLIGVPCVGSPVRAGALAMDKWASKLVASAVGVAVAPGRLVHAGDHPTWPGPCVVKPVAAGSSQGVSLVASATDWADALTEAFAHDDRVLVEDVLVGREIDISVLATASGDLLVSPPLEVSVDGFFDFDAKYGGGARFGVPTDLTRAQLDELRAAALAIWQALGCSGVARVDFFLTAQGWVFNEVNTVPGMTPTSQVPQMFAALGLDYVGLCDELVRAAVDHPRVSQVCPAASR